MLSESPKLKIHAVVVSQKATEAEKVILVLTTKKRKWFMIEFGKEYCKDDTSGTSVLPVS